MSRSPELTSWDDRAVAERTLAVDTLARRVFAQLAARGCDVVMLKGRSTAAALYGPGESRGISVDVDLLAPPSAGEPVAAVLTELGYAPRPYRAPGEHATTWMRSGLPDVDVHETLAGLLAHPEEVWAALNEHRSELSVAGIKLPVLDRAGLALHVTLHAAQHGRDGGRPIRDLERAVARIGDSDWQEAARLARRLDGAAAFGAGLRLVADGRELAERLAIPKTQSLLVAARADSVPAGTRYLAHAIEQRGVLPRARAALWAIVPPPAVMRGWYPDSSLPAADIRRPVRVLRRAPAVFRELRRARRRSQAD